MLSISDSSQDFLSGFSDEIEDYSCTSCSRLTLRHSTTDDNFNVSIVTACATTRGLPDGQEVCIICNP